MLQPLLCAVLYCLGADMWDAYRASQGKNGPLGGSTWGSMDALAAANSSIMTPHNILPQALSLPLVLAGAGGGSS